MYSLLRAAVARRASIPRSGGYHAAVGRKRPERTERRSRERSARRLVQDRERLAGLLPGGAQERPLLVDSVAVIDGRVRSMRCPQCEGGYAVDDDRAVAPGLRCIAVTCRLCHVARSIWFRIGAALPS